MSTATATTLPTGLPSRRDERARSPRPWPRRRRWLDSVALAAQLTTGCRGWLLLLAGRSDDAGAPVWGCQAKMAAQLGCSERTVRRYAVEAAAAGFVKVFRAKPLRGPDGRFYRRRSNVYYLTQPVAEPQEATEGPRRRRKAGYCVLKSRSHLPDTHGPSTAPDGAREPASPRQDLKPLRADDETGEIIDPDVFQAGLEAARAALRAARPGGLRA
jgi:hypothetical protein